MMNVYIDHAARGNISSAVEKRPLCNYQNNTWSSQQWHSLWSGPGTPGRLWIQRFMEPQRENYELLVIGNQKLVSLIIAKTDRNLSGKSIYIYAF